MPCSGCRGQADIVFLADSSGSINDLNFRHIIRFVDNLTSYFDVDAGRQRVALITFSDNAHIEFHLNKYNKMEPLREAIRSAPYNYGSTNTAEALRTVNNIFTKNRGDRADVQVRSPGVGYSP